MSVDLPKGLEGDTYDDKQTSATEVELNIKTVCDDRGYQTNRTQIKSTGQRQTINDLPQEL